MAYDKLNLSIDHEWATEWSAAEETALRLRGDLLKIYTVDSNPGEYPIVLWCSLLNVSTYNVFSSPLTS